MYSARLLDHFEHPRFAGDLPGADVVVTVENPACGDVLQLAVKVKDEVVTNVRFKAKGCVPAMACGSAVSQWIERKRLSEIASVKAENVVCLVERLPPASGHAAELAVEAVHQLLRRLQGR